ncbi:hypoxia-inducible factor 1-alpha-like [Mercenaria mercenaria]|uniref:hypoxia-inducible factor 1-alpha-like n=1 Tax=Mercenaria mercenaria TaxID=6596 RepID=UPI00234F3C13|nr:hypoxia-inducible factor 1-alpha-like [Mercenaria mercenaria]XP_053400163.1 hypoxia-inducible factor 1-alpha-like [Mercenaria mercenaria]XP_053400164.1 hypoxia-inducible factor 1-alpha-like [Mercenaria mercenaria]
MDDDDDDAVVEEKPCASKLSRKVGEKLRRDRLNGLITQLAEEIPIIKYAHRRLDKSAILRLTVSYMKLHLGLKRKKLGCNASLQDVGMLNWLKKVTDDALLIITQSGTIIYVSTKIFDMLGFYQTDMVGHNIKRFVHPDDLSVLMSQFSGPTDVSLQSAYSRFAQETGYMVPDNCQPTNTACNSFCVQMLRAARRKQMVGEAKEYETISVRANCEKSLGIKNKNSANELWMIALLKPFSYEPIKDIEIKIAEFMKNNEWATMHDLDSRIVASDHRASLFHGYMPSEIIGKTPYMLIREDDLEPVAVSHQMIMKNHQILSTVFRMNNKFDLIIYVQSQSIIVNDQWTKKPKCIVSVNTVLSSEEGKHLLDAQRKRTQEFMKLQQKQEVEKLVPLKQEVESDDSNDSVKGHSLGQSTLSKDKLLKMKMTSGKSLNEIYENYSQSFPNMYRGIDSCSGCKKSEFSEKRSHDYMDSDSSGLESTCSGNTGSETSSLNVTEDEADSPKHRSPSLKDLLSDEKCLEKASSGIKTSDQLTKEHPFSFQKGILKGKRKMEKGVRGPGDDKSQIFSETAAGKGTSIVASVSVARGGTECQGHAAAGHTAGVQSPTVDSSGSAEGTADVSVKPSVYCRFSSQLVNKHGMLKQTIDSQKLTLEILRDQLQKSHNNVILSSQQKQIHDSLIEKITEAENQVVVQGQLLGELEQEILNQQQHIELNHK